MPSLQLTHIAIFYKYAQLRLIALLLLLLRCNARTAPLRQALVAAWALILVRAPTPTGRFGRGLFRADGPTSLPLLVFIDEALEVP